MRVFIRLASFESVIIEITDDVKRDVMIDCRRLPEVHPACVRSGVEPPYARHAQDRRPGADPEVGTIAERRWFRPEIWSQLLL